jgi:hypothetical protein
MGTSEERDVPVGLNGVRLKHEGATGIAGVLSLIEEVMGQEGWFEGVTTVQIVTKRDREQGTVEVVAYNVTEMADEGIPTLTEVEE